MSRQRLCGLLLVVGSLSLCAAGAAAAWLDAVPLMATGTDSETGLNHTPLAYDAAGGLHVVWAERDTPGANYQIYARHRAWAAWGAPELVVAYPDPQPGALLGAKFPSLAAAGDSLWMAWHDYRHGGIFNAEIYVQAMHLDTGWQEPLRLTTTANVGNPGDNGYVPTVVERAGELHVLWYDYRWHPEAADVYHAHRGAGGWTTALGDSADVNVSRAVTDGWDAGVPATAIGPDGTVAAVWVDRRSGVERLRCAGWSGGVWSSPETVYTAGSTIDAPTAAWTTDGALHALAVVTEAGGRSVTAWTRDAFGAWSSPVALTDPTFLAAEPCLVAGSDDVLHWVWQDARLGVLDREIFHRSRLVGEPWPVDAAGDVNLSAAPGRQDRPSLAVDALGNRAVLWRDGRTGANEIHLREFRPGGPIAVGEVPAPAVALPMVIGPNPVGVAVRLRIGRQGARVFDASGRLVRRLPAGASSWDGTARGRRLPRGLYLLRDDASGAAARVVLR